MPVRRNQFARKPPPSQTNPAKPNTSRRQISHISQWLMSSSRGTDYLAPKLIKRRTAEFSCISVHAQKILSHATEINISPCRIYKESARAAREPTQAEQPVTLDLRGNRGHRERDRRKTIGEVEL